LPVKRILAVTDVRIKSDLLGNKPRGGKSHFIGRKTITTNEKCRRLD